MEIYTIKNLSFSYSDETEKALSDISLSVNTGEFVTVCGKSGCGKSTLLRLMKTAISPYGKKDGSILFNGIPLENTDERTQSEKIGFVSQNPDNQIVTDKVWHELAFGLESLGIPTSEIRSRVAEMASFFGIQTWFHKKTSELSGGQKQLLNLASVMAMQPEVIILDEPTSQLDPIAAQEFLNALSKINSELGITVILSEHRLEEAFPLSDRIIAMDSGMIIYDGRPDEICTEQIRKSDIFPSLPAAVKVYASVNEGKSCPVTVRGGRRFLSELITAQKTFKPDIPEKKADKAPVLELKELCFRYEKASPDIIKNLSAKIYKGELYAIVGGNGTGKTTTLSLISGLLKPYSGKILYKGEVCKGIKAPECVLLPQNPQDLFVKNTVISELSDIAEKKRLTPEEKKSRIDRVTELCELDGLLYRHPYDLSGGEQQKAALAMILLNNPEILLLDEPTKGLDAHFKYKLAEILKSLTKKGVTVIMVSHDIEFCAEFADRCAMFFDGAVISENEPREFFSGKSFYTTAANRMSRGIINGAVLYTDIIKSIGGSLPKAEAFSHKGDSGSDISVKIPDTAKSSNNKDSSPPPKRALSPLRIISGVLLLILCLITVYLFKGKYTDWHDILYQLISIGEAAGGLYLLLPKKQHAMASDQSCAKKKGGLKALIPALTVLFLIPLTIYIGFTYLENKKYYFVSLLIILEATAAFFAAFESKKPRAKELVILSTLCALGVAGRAAFYPVPQFKPVAALVIISGVCLGPESGFLVGAMTAFVSNFMFGQGIWTPWQMFAFGLLGFLSGALASAGILKRERLPLSVFGAGVVLIVYGIIMNTSGVILYQTDPTLEMLAASCILGLPFDLIHAFSTVFFLWFCSDTMTEKLERIKRKYGAFR